MRELSRFLLLIVLVLLVPIIPFVFLGDRLESWFVAWTRDDLPTSLAAWFVFLSLASDILLPVPSSVVCTFAGDRLGVLAGTLISWLGMTAGACGGYGLAFVGGEPLVRRFADPATLGRMQRLSQRWGPFLIVLTRAVPVLAEATVLWLGLQRIEGRRLWLPLCLSNLGIALAYALFGSWAGEHGWLVFAMIASAMLPLLLWLLVRRQLERLDKGTVHE